MLDRALVLARAMGAAAPAAPSAAERAVESWAELRDMEVQRALKRAILLLSAVRPLRTRPLQDEITKAMVAVQAVLYRVSRVADDKLALLVGTVFQTLQKAYGQLLPKADG